MLAGSAPPARQGRKHAASGISEHPLHAGRGHHMLNMALDANAKAGSGVQLRGALAAAARFERGRVRGKRQCFVNCGTQRPSAESMTLLPATKLTLYATSFTFVPASLPISTRSMRNMTFFFFWEKSSEKPRLKTWVFLPNFSRGMVYGYLMNGCAPGAENLDFS